MFDRWRRLSRVRICYVVLFTPIKVGRRLSDGNIIAHTCVIFPEIESELPRHIVVLNLEDV